MQGRNGTTFLFLINKFVTLKIDDCNSFDGETHVPMLPICFLQIKSLHMKESLSKKCHQEANADIHALAFSHAARQLL